MLLPVVVDSSVWINHLRGLATPKVETLRKIITEVGVDVLVGDLILCEVLQGLDTERESARVLKQMSEFRTIEMVGAQIAEQSARNYRTLRRRGITIRNTMDMLIGTYCIVHDCLLLHDDRDFDAMAQPLGLQVMAGSALH